VIVSVTDAPAPSGLPTHTTVNPLTPHPLLDDATFVTPDGNTSVNTNPDEPPGPKFVTVNEYVTFPPGSTNDGLADFTTPRSVFNPGAVVMVAVEGAEVGDVSPAVSVPVAVAVFVTFPAFWSWVVTMCWISPVHVSDAPGASPGGARNGNATPPSALSDTDSVVRSTTAGVTVAVSLTRDLKLTATTLSASRE
jgi:hypothetical protein